MYGGSRVRVHLCVLFNLFVKHGYVPVQFMKSVIVPFVKSKTGDLSAVYNYRAIAISTSISKLFENVLSEHVKSVIILMHISLVSPPVAQLVSALVFLHVM